MSQTDPYSSERLAAIRDEWLAIGLSTAPADRPAAEEGVRLAYAAEGLAPPRDYVWLQSPYAGMLEAAMSQIRAQIRAQVRATTVAVAQAVERVWMQVVAQVVEEVWGQVWMQAGEDVWAQVWAQVWRQIWRQIWEAQARGQVWPLVGGYGQHHAGWFAFHAAFRDDLPCVHRLDGLMQVARSCGWWWPTTGAIILTERPCLLRRDAAHRLHAEDGPAVQYPDGWGVWAWHGTRVPREVIETPVTVERIAAEPNVEIRRVLTERMGWARWLDASGAIPVHADEMGTLYRMADLDLALVSVLNATPEPDGRARRYVLPVPPTMQTAREAVAWTFGLNAREYQPAIES